jgi:hypothetical protein
MAKCFGQNQAASIWQSLEVPAIVQLNWKFIFHKEKYYNLLCYLENVIEAFGRKN